MHRPALSGCAMSAHIRVLFSVVLIDKLPACLYGHLAVHICVSLANEFD